MIDQSLVFFKSRLFDFSLGLLLLFSSSSSHAISVMPASSSLELNQVQTFLVSKVVGAMSVKVSKEGVLRINKIGPSTYEIQGLAPGVVSVFFLDAKGQATAQVTVNTPPVAANPVGRLLASNCFQCHGTNGAGGFDQLTGKTESELYGDLKEFARGKEDPTGVMAAHAMGYTDAQLRQIAKFFASVR